MNMRLFGFALIACGFLVFVPGAGSGVACAQVTLLGPGTVAYGVSADGRRVAGYDSTDSFIWTAEGGIGHINFAGSQAYGISGDGSTVVGHGGGQRPLRWRSPGPAQLLPVPAPYLFGRAFDASNDGSVVVGRLDRNFAPSNAFRWTQAGGMQLLPLAASGSEALGVSGDGNIVVGTTGAGGFLRAYVWSQAGGTQILPVLAGTQECHGTAISLDGTIVVGWSDLGALLWRNGVLEPMQPALQAIFQPTCVSDGGSLVGGDLPAIDGSRYAAVRTVGGSPRRLTDFVASFGLTFPAGYVPRLVTGVSPDGLTIVGRGADATGSNAFVVTIPAPGTLGVLLAGAFAARRRRSRAPQPLASVWNESNLGVLSLPIFTRAGRAPLSSSRNFTRIS